MKRSSLITQLVQPALFDFGTTSIGSLELFPSIWSAAEALTFPDVSTRRAGLSQLENMGAVRLSPLITYLVSTRLTDSDMEIRCQVITSLGNVYKNDDQGYPAPEVVRQVLSGRLSQMRTREIYSILKAVANSPEIEEQALQLLSVCPYAGNHLTDILLNRKFPLAIRRQAVHFINRVGYVDAIPGLERLAIRLESHLNGQQTMPFFPSSEMDETALLPEVQAALTMLRSP
jgi:hypothetical protein